MIKETKEILDDGSVLYGDGEDEGFYRISKNDLWRYSKMMPRLFEQIKKFHECMNNIETAVCEMDEISNNIEQITGPEKTQIALEYNAVYDAFFDVYSEMATRLNRLAKLVIK